MNKRPGPGTVNRAAEAKGGKGKSDKVSVTPVSNGRGGRADVNVSIEASGTQITNVGRKGKGGRNDALASHDSSVGAKQKSDASEPHVKDVDEKIQQKGVDKKSKKDKEDEQKAKTELTELRSRVDKELKKGREDLQKANEELAGLRESFDKESNKWKEYLLEANKKLTELRTRIEKLPEEKKKLEKDMTLLQTNMKKERDRLEKDLKEKMMEFTKYQTKLNSADTELKQRENALGDLQTKLSTTDAERKKVEKQLSEVQSRFNTEAESKKSATELRELKSKLQTVEADNKQREEELRVALQTAETQFKQREKELNSLMAEQSNKIQELTAANDELRTRLSKHFGAKLQDNNPNIADLSDPNRPTKLAEKFSELYDNEWTNCFEVLKKNETEVDVVEILLTACVKIYDHCIKRASTELEDLHRVFRDFNSGSDIQLQKQLKDSRKKLKPDQQFQSKIESELKDHFGEKIVRKITPYVQSCLDICWSMAIQDPPVHMDTHLKMNGQPFDIAAYRAYTQSGLSVEFIVWPALYLHENGSLLQKGIAQGMAADGKPATQVKKNNKVTAS